jgi:hypothetical protein
MGMRDEIEALRAHVSVGGVELLPRSDVLRIIDRHAAPVVDMTKGGVLHIPVLPINGQDEDDADLAAILAVRDRKKKRTPL